MFNEYLVNQLNIANASPLIEVNKLWENNFNDAQSLLFGYLLLHPKYISLMKIHYEDITRSLYHENEDICQKFIGNNLSLSDIEVIDDLDLSTLKTAFQLIPNKTKNLEHKNLAKNIIKIFADKVFFKIIIQDENEKKLNTILNDAYGTYYPTVNVIKEDKISNEIKHDFIKKFSYFILTCDTKEIYDYLKPILDNFNSSERVIDCEIMAELFKEIINAEDHTKSYDNFWVVFYLFNPKVIELCNSNNNLRTEKIVKSYLFSQNFWKETAFEWHTFKEKDKKFFEGIATQIGNNPSVLFAIAKILDGIGSCYLNDGIVWIANMLDKNKDIFESKLEADTIYYLEHISKKYIYKKREEIKRTKQLKQEILIILNFLVKNGSVVGYMLRENIL